MGVGALLLGGLGGVGACLGSPRPNLPTLEVLWSPPVEARGFWGVPTSHSQKAHPGAGQARCHKGVPELGKVPGVPTQPHCHDAALAPLHAPHLATWVPPKQPCVAARALRQVLMASLPCKSELTALN